MTKIEKNIDLYGELVNNSFNEIYLFDTVSYKFIYLNTSALNNLGYTLEEMIELTPIDIKPDHDVNSFEKLIFPLRNKKKTKIQFCTNHQRKDGTLYPVEVHLQLNSKKKNPYFSAFIIDITERKFQEIKLKKSEKSLLEAQRLAKIGSFNLDLKTQISKTSASFNDIIGIDLDSELTFNLWRTITHPDDAPTNQKALEECLKTGENFDLEYRILTKNTQELKWIHGLGKVIYKDDEPAFFFGTIQDITEKKEKEKELRITNENLQDLVYIASHDLQIPLVSMVGYTTNLLENNKENINEEVVFSLKRIQSNAYRMHKLVLSLLDISRLNTEKKSYQKFSLTKLINKIIKDISLTIEKSNAKITVTKLPNLFADKERIEDVFRNLLLNALIYESKKIEIGFKNNVFFIKDDGLGIPETQLKKIFKPGERLKMNKVDGSGMGLTFCEKVLEQHDGKIWATSKGPNTGTTIYLKLNSKNILKS